LIENGLSAPIRVCPASDAVFLYHACIQNIGGQTSRFVENNILTPFGRSMRDSDPFRSSSQQQIVKYGPKVRLV